MRTPEEIAREIEHISWQAGVVIDYDPEIAALIAAWRDECVAEKITGDDWAMALLKTRAEAAEAERDRLKAEMRFIEESMRPMARINAELEADVRRLRDENEALRSLVDGAEEVVELFGARSGYVGQKRWAAGWLDKARALLRKKGETK